MSALDQRVVTSYQPKRPPPKTGASNAAHTSSGPREIVTTLATAQERKIVILRLREFMRRTGLSRSATYYKMDPDHPLHDPLFPKSIRLGLHGRAVGWVESECNAYLESLISASRKHNSLGENE